MSQKAEETTETTESREDPRVVIEAADDAVVVADGDGKILLWNPAAERIFGYTAQEALGKEYITLIVHPGGRERCRRGLEEAGRLKQKRREVVEGLRKDGTTFPLEHSVSREETADGVRLIAFLRDVTERKRMEEALKRASQEWDVIFNSISDLVSIHARNHEILKVNKALTDFVGKKPEELIGKHCYEVFHGTTEPWINCPQAMTFKTSKATTAEVKGQNICCPLEVTTSPIFDEAGGVVAVVHIARDITERKRAEDEVREWKDFYETVINGIGDPISVIDPGTYRIIGVNKAFLRSSGLEEEDVVGKTCYEVTHNRSTPCGPPNDLCPLEELLS